MIAHESAWEVATREGMSYFWAYMYAGHAVTFVGHWWEDGGFDVDDHDHPVRDAQGNSVAYFAVEKLNSRNSAHVSKVDEWWG